MTVLALYSNKGGVGKTAAAVNLAYLAAQSGKRTLICDLDPQSSATFYFRVKPRLKASARGLSKGGKPIDKSIKGTDYDNLDLLPADFTHRNLDISFASRKDSLGRLSRVLDPLQDEYDLIVLDSPPTINVVAENIIAASDHLLVPLIPTTLSVRTHEQLMQFMDSRKRDTVDVTCFRSMVDRRKKMHRELSESIAEEIDGVLESIIPFASVVERMGIRREPVPVFAGRSKAAQAYRDLWAEIEEKLLGQA
ncbi:MAG: ParA family protein [Chloroflexota bacterium]|nr:ParA family protein [Chloroflexota bacterium]